MYWHGFGFDEYISHLKQMLALEPMQELLEAIPGFRNRVEEDLRRVRPVAQSMTPKERRLPEIIDISRRRRIARGSGVKQYDVANLIAQFLKTRDTMEHLRRPRHRFDL